MDKRKFYSLTVRTVLPLMLQSILNSSVNFFDQVMVGKLGVSQIAAVGAANKIYSLFYLILYGTCCACVMFISQYWGRREIDGVRKIMGMTFTVTIPLGVFVTMATCFFPRQCMALFTKDVAVIHYGTGYLRALSASYLLLSFIYPINYLLRGQTRVKIVLAASTCSVFMNIIANYMFIFGNFGMPRLEVVGAAIGTVATRVVELTILLIYLYISRNEAVTDIRAMFRFTVNEFVYFIKKVIPLASNEFFWGLGTSVYLIIYGHMGTDELAVMSIMNTLQTMVQTFGLSLSSSAAVIVGHEIGKGNRTTVNEYSKRFHMIAIMMGAAVGTAVFLLVPLIVKAYSLNGLRTGKMLSQTLIIMCMYLPLSSYNSMNIEGLFKSGGDIRYVLLMDMGGIWMVGMPLQFILGYVMKLPLVIVFLVYVIVEIYKMILGIIRYKSGKWLHTLVLA